MSKSIRDDLEQELAGSQIGQEMYQLGQSLGADVRRSLHLAALIYERARWLIRKVRSLPGA